MTNKITKDKPKIALDQELKDKLDAMGSKGDTYNDIMRRVLVKFDGRKCMMARMANDEI